MSRDRCEPLPAGSGKEPPLPTGEPSGKRSLLMIVPWLVMGGADKFNLNLVQQLTSQGWQVTIASTETALDVWHDEFARYTPDIFLLHQTLELQDYPAFLRELILSREPDIVFISNSELGYLLLPYLRSCCPAPVYLDYCHSEELHWRDGGFPALSVRFRDYLDATLVASGHLNKWMQGRGGEAERIFVRYIGVDALHWHPDPSARREVRERLGIPGQAVVVLYAARLSPEKLPLLFAEVMRALVPGHPSLVVLVAGEGELQVELAGYLESQGLSGRVSLLGNVPVLEMPALMAASDIFFLPSLYEGISLAVYEAMACGLAVVSADVGGQRELVRAGAGVLVPGGAGGAARDGYLEALAALLGDAAQRFRMGQAARELVLREFSLPQMADGFEELCRWGAQNRRTEFPMLDAAAAEGSAGQAVAYLRAFGRDAAALGRLDLPFRVKLYARITRLLNPLYFWCLDRQWRWVIALKNLIRKGMGVDG